MARHRKRPGPRHQRGTHARPFEPAEPRETSLGTVLRRVVVTPTFAAGLGVVVAAVLASQMGAPAFRVTMPRWNGQRCATPGCQGSPAHGGPASAKSGQPLPPPAPSATAGAASAPPGEARPAVSPAAVPLVTYQTQGSSAGGFEGYLRVSFADGHIPVRWGLRFSYPASQIQRVWGEVRWQPQGDHVALVTSPTSAQPAPGHDIQVWFKVTGQAGRPSGCSFNHVACHFR